MDFVLVLQIPSTSQKQACRWTGDSKMPSGENEYVNVCLHYAMMDWCSTQVYMVLLWPWAGLGTYWKWIDENNEEVYISDYDSFNLTCFGVNWGLIHVFGAQHSCFPDLCLISCSVGFQDGLSVGQIFVLGNLLSHSSDSGRGGCDHSEAKPCWIRPTALVPHSVTGQNQKWVFAWAN